MRKIWPLKSIHPARSYSLLKLLLLSFLAISKPLYGNGCNLDLTVNEVPPFGSKPVSAIANESDLIQVSKAQIRTIQNSVLKQERYSGLHQDDVLKFVSLDSGLKIDRAGMELGIIISDLGKTGAYRKYLTEKSIHSDFLLDVITGRDTGGKSSIILAELLNELGFGSSKLLNPKLSNDEIRGLFSELPVLSGFLHELPGMLDVFLAFERGIISPELLKKLLAANLFHNGPAKGFWGLITDIFVPGALKKSENPAAGIIFDGTVFSLNGKISYPLPQSVEGILHSIGDRLSQATRGGIMKIHYEISAFTNPLDGIASLCINNQLQSLEQLQELRKHISAFPIPNKMGPHTAAEKEKLIEVVDIAITRIEDFSKALQQEIGNFEQVRAAINNTPPTQLSSLSFSGTTYNQTQLIDPLQLSAFISHVENTMTRIEASIGNPLRPFTETFLNHR